MEDVLNELMWTNIEIACPTCGYRLDVLIREIHEERTVICRGCHTGIRLKNEGESPVLMVDEAEAAIEDFFKTLTIGT